MTPQEAYSKARNGGKATDETRRIASQDPMLAVCYAFYVDCGPHEVTRAGVCQATYAAYVYALTVDCCLTVETRKAVATDPFLMKSLDSAFPSG